MIRGARHHGGCGRYGIVATEGRSHAQDVTLFTVTLGIGDKRIVPPVTERYVCVAMPRRSTEAALAAVRTAAADVLAARGVGGFTVDEVATRSGVAKTTIYRHWDSVHDLLIDTVAARVEPVPTPNHGDLAADLRELYDRFSEVAATSGLRLLMLDLLAAAGRDPDLARAQQAMMGERTRPVRTVLELARHRGELPAGIDLDLATDFVQGAAVHRIVIQGGSLDPGEVERIINAVIAGLRALD